MQKKDKGTRPRRLLDPVISELLEWASEDVRRYRMLVSWYRRTRMMLVMRGNLDLARQVVFEHDSGRSLDDELHHRDSETIGVDEDHA